MVIGFGATEERFEEQEREFYGEFLRSNRKLDSDIIDWYTFEDECVERLKALVKERTEEFHRKDEEYKNSEEYPERYSHYYATVLHDMHNVVIVADFMHINRRHALSPDGWALMKSKAVFHYGSNDL